MADETPLSASTILGRYYTNLIREGVPMDVAGRITQDAAHALHCGDSAMEIPFVPVEVTA